MVGRLIVRQSVGVEANVFPVLYHELIAHFKILVGNGRLIFKILISSPSFVRKSRSFLHFGSLLRFHYRAVPQ